ncbi:MAG: DUF2585 family protein [Acidobacteria bacterium]|nr:DUF2585 family protein [Acidobacteriota bacterium]
MDESRDKQNYYLPLLIAVAAVTAMVVALWLQDRVWWCKLGDYSIYVNDAWNSSHTSQHFLDPYTFTHVLHGVLFFWIAGVLLTRLSGTWRLVVAVAAEAAWEVLENSNFIIDKYRENTASLDYFGDSIFNSIGDVAACAIGFQIAVKLGWFRSLLFFLAVEAVLLLWIRDGLLLNILMLIYPLETVKHWQMGQ